MVRWNKLAPADLAGIAGQLSNSSLVSGIRHLLEVRLADDPGAARIGFSYRESDPARHSHCGYVQMLFPPDFSCDELLALTQEIAATFPIWAAVAGWTASWNRALPQTAMPVVLAWTRRYMGLDVQHLDYCSRHVGDGLSSTGWLTLLSPALCNAKGIAADEVPHAAKAGEIIHMPFAQAHLFKAGTRPLLGDRHAFQECTAQAALAVALDGALSTQIPSFPGPFREEGLTDAWRYRLSRAGFY